MHAGNKRGHAAMGLLGTTALLLMAQLLLAAQPYNWQQAVIKGGGFITGVYFHPTNASVAYARTDMGGAYRWNPAANTWIPLQDGVGVDDYWSLHGICSIALDPTMTTRSTCSPACIPPVGEPCRHPQVQRSRGHVDACEPAVQERCQ